MTPSPRPADRDPAADRATAAPGPTAADPGFAGGPGPTGDGPTPEEGAATAGGSGPAGEPGPTGAGPDAADDTPAAPGPAGESGPAGEPGVAGDGGGVAETTSTRGLLAGLALGVPVMAYGLRGVFVDAGDTHPAELARWFVGLALVNDVVVVPVLLAAAWALRRVTPAWAWPALRAGLTVAGTLALVAWPFVRGYGRDPTNPSRLPRDYGAGLAAALAAVAAATAAALAARAVARRRSRTGGDGEAMTAGQGFSRQ